METDVEHAHSVESDAKVEVALTFGQIEAVLADLHGVAPERRVAFAGRLKALQRNGLPAGDRPGRGRSASFSFMQFLQFTLGLELVRSGISPADAAKLVKDNWLMLQHSIGYACNQFWNIASPASRNGIKSELNLVWSFGLNDLRELQSNNSKVLDTRGSGEALHPDMLASIYGGAHGSFSPPPRILVAGGKVILSSSEAILSRGYTNEDAIACEVLQSLDAIEGLKPETPPWSSEALEFYDNQMEQSVVDAIAMDFVRIADFEIKQLLRQFAAAGCSTEGFSGAQILKFLEAGQWGIYDIRADDSKFLTRVGRRALELLERGGSDVDPQA